MPEPTPIEIRDLRAEDIPAAVGVLARGMRDNPMHVAAYGDDPDDRLRCHAKLMRAVLHTMRAWQPICATRDGLLVGVTGVAPPGTCQSTALQRLRMLPAVLPIGPRRSMRVRRWIADWAERDLAEPHVHLGPLAVDAHLQGHGIGSQIMREYCHRLDHHRHVGYLETDKPQNVPFYQRFDFAVIGEADVLGVHNWFMRRPVRAHDRRQRATSGLEVGERVRPSAVGAMRKLAVPDCSSPPEELG